MNLRLKFYFYQTILDPDVISLDPVPDRKTLPTPNIKLPSMPPTLYNMPADRSFRQRRAFVWTEIIDGIVFAIHIEHG